MFHPLALPGVLAQTTPAQVWGRGTEVMSMDSGVRSAHHGMQIQSLTSRMTLDNIFMRLSFLFCKRGIVLLTCIHWIAVHLHVARACKLNLLRHGCEDKTQRLSLHKRLTLS